MPRAPHFADDPFSRRSSRLPGLVLLAVSLAVVAYFVRPRGEVAGQGPAVGKSVPPLRLVPLSLEDPTSDSGTRAPVLRGRVTVLHYWGTWCGPCRNELPEIARLHARLIAHPDYQLLSVSCASFDDPSLATLRARTGRFYRSSGIDLPTYADPSTSARRALLCLMQREQMVYPTTVLVDRSGTVRATWTGIPPGGIDTIYHQAKMLLDQE